MTHEKYEKQENKEGRTKRNLKRIRLYAAVIILIGSTLCGVYRYRMAEKKKANDLYTAGVSALEQKDYVGSQEQFQKLVDNKDYPYAQVLVNYAELMQAEQTKGTWLSKLKQMADGLDAMDWPDEFQDEIGQEVASVNERDNIQKQNQEEGRKENEEGKKRRQEAAAKYKPKDDPKGSQSVNAAAKSGSQDNKKSGHSSAPASRNNTRNADKDIDHQEALDFDDPDDYYYEYKDEYDSFEDAWDAWDEAHDAYESSK